MKSAAVALALLISIPSVVPAAEWSGFRGPNGSGVAVSGDIPNEWSDTRNLKWKRELPGPGSSSPIVVGDQVFVTSFSGYGASGGKLEDLRRHVVCLHQDTGEILWQETVAAEMPEDPWSRMLGEHGYASNTAVSDG